MKEILEKLTKRTEETNAHLEINAALSQERNAALKVQSFLAKQQDEKLRSLVNITKAGLLGDQREKSVARLQEDLKESRQNKRDSNQKDSDEKSFNLREQAKELQQRSVALSEGSLAILRFNVFNDLRRRIMTRKAQQLAENRSRLMAQSLVDIRSNLAADGKTNLELLKAYKDPAEKTLMQRTAAGIASLVKITKDGETRSPTLKLIKYFKDRDKRAAIAAKEKAQETMRMASNPDLMKNIKFGKAPAKGFLSATKLVLTRIGAYLIALAPIIKGGLGAMLLKALPVIKVVAKRFFVLGMVIAAFRSIAKAIKVFSSTEGNFGEKFLAAIGEFSKTFISDIIGGTIAAIKFLGIKLAELFGADPNSETMKILKAWSPIDAVRGLWDGVTTALTELVVGLVGEIMDGATMFGPDSNWLQSTIGVILGLGKGLLIGIVDGVAELFGSLLQFDPFADSDLGQMFKDFSMKDWLEGTVRPFILSIPDRIAEFFTNVFDKFMAFINEKAMDSARFVFDVNDKLKQFVQSVLPDRKGGGVMGFVGDKLIPDGIYDWAYSGGGTKPAKKKTTPVPQVSNPGVGARLMEMGAKAAATVVNVVNNNGGNVSNSTTSNQVNNSRSSSPILLGSALNS